MFAVIQTQYYCATQIEIVLTTMYVTKNINNKCKNALIQLLKNKFFNSIIQRYRKWHWLYFCIKATNREHIIQECLFFSRVYNKLRIV